MVHALNLSNTVLIDLWVSSSAESWIRACASRLRELRPQSDCVSVAVDLWRDVGTFDPRLAAEMEHEAWPIDD